MITSARTICIALLFGAINGNSFAKFGPEDLKISGKSGIIVDAVSGKVLWSKSPDVRRFPASTTKMMTSMVIREMLELTDNLQAPNDVTKITGSSLHLKPREIISVKDALYGIMLRSANDVCYSAAIAISGSETAFAELMNEKALELNCTNTHFNNPHGLTDPKHYTTARDLSIIGRAMLKDEFLAQVVKTKSYHITRNLNKADTEIITRNKWLLKDSTADGIKTGFTDAAGHCYVGSATREGFQIVTVILNSPDTKVDQKAMLDWAYGRYSLNKESKGTEVATIKVKDGEELLVPVILDEDVQMLDVDGMEPEVVLPVQEVTAPISLGQNLGKIKLRASDGSEIEVRIVAAKAVGTKPLLMKLKENPIALLAFGGVLCGAWFMRRRHRNF